MISGVVAEELVHILILQCPDYVRRTGRLDTLFIESD